MVEFYESPNSANWLMGENCMAPGCGYIALRDLKNPHNPSVTSPSPAKMSEYYNLPETGDGDWGGVHVNCTIPGHAMYLISESIGKDKMEKIIYRTFIYYLTCQSQFIDLRLNAIQAAQDLYPGTGTDTKVAQAFDLVEITDGDPTDPDDPYQPVSGPDYILMVYADNSQILTAKPTIPFDNSSVTWFDAYTSNKPSITEDGSVAVYIGTDQNIYLIDVENKTVDKISDNCSWHNIAVSPQGDFLAVVPDPQKISSKIYLGDVVNGTWETRDLYIPNTGTGTYMTASYADILDWSNYGGILVYDCYYQIQQQGGSPIGRWGIYLMQVQNETIVSLFQPLKDIDVGNPVFSNTRDHVIAFDFIDYSKDRDNPEYYVLSYDLFAGEVGVIHLNQKIFGHPGFSPDDKKVVFQDQKVDETFYLSQIDLMQDGLNGDESSYKPWVHPVKMPVWYATGSRPSSTVILVNEGFDDQFPPDDWQISATDQSHTWKQSNVKDHLFSEIDPGSKFSAVCPYSASTDQDEWLFSCDFSLAKGDANINFYIGYNKEWLNNFSLKLYIMNYQNLQELLWVAVDDGESGWKWRKIHKDLSSYAGMPDLYLAWRYQGKDGDTIALDGVQLSGIKTGVEDKGENHNLPVDLVLFQNYPNPFNPTTTFTYQLPEKEFVTLSIFNTSGQLVETLVNKELDSGTHYTVWNATHLSSGIYFYQLKAGEHLKSDKCLLIK